MVTICLHLVILLRQLLMMGNTVEVILTGLLLLLKSVRVHWVINFCH